MGLFEWMGTIVVSTCTAFVTGVLGYLTHRMNKHEDNLDRVEHDLRDEIDRVGKQDSDGRDDLRREVQLRLDAIYSRLDQNATKQDLHHMASIILGRKIGVED
jgi:hypothetical protein